MRTEIATPRLIIRPTQAEDIDSLLSIFVDSRVAPWFLATREPDYRSSPNYLLQGPDTWEKERRIQLTAFCRDESLHLSTPVGGARIAQGEISYYIAPTFWRQGYGFELVSAVSAFAENLRLQKLTATVLRENVASRKILERIGFEFAGLQYCADSSHRGRYAVLRFRLCSSLASRAPFCDHAEEKA